MPKSRDAFRTISEVAEWLDTQPHVLRFWESKFSQVRPVKRAGGRRYYRPADMQLLGGIKKLLHDDGMTIKGVQKLLREKGIKDISALSKPLDDEGDEAAMIEATIAREIPEAIEKLSSDPLEDQISDLMSAPSQETSVSPAPSWQEVAAESDPETEAVLAETTLSDDIEDAPLTFTATGNQKVPRNPLADVAESWSMRERLVRRMMNIRDVDPAHRSEITRALSALQKLRSGENKSAHS